MSTNQEEPRLPEAESSRWRIIHYVFLLALCLLTGLLVYWIAKPYLNPILTAILLAVVYYPLHLRWVRLVGNPNLGALFSTLTVLLTLVIPFILLGVALKRELGDLYQLLSQQSAQDGGWGPWLAHTSERLNGWLHSFIDAPPLDLQELLLEQLRKASATAFEDAATLLGNLASFFVDGVISFFTLFFVFRDGRELYDRLAAILPLRPGQIERLRVEIGRTITASVYGGLAVAVSQG
ncbi:MAG: AI-2E family transporter, partial [Acidobacteriota bacterium]